MRCQVRAPRRGVTWETVRGRSSGGKLLPGDSELLRTVLISPVSAMLSAQQPLMRRGFLCITGRVLCSVVVFLSDRCGLVRDDGDKCQESEVQALGKWSKEAAWPV